MASSRSSRVAQLERHPAPAGSGSETSRCSAWGRPRSVLPAATLMVFLSWKPVRGVGIRGPRLAPGLGRTRWCAGSGSGDLQDGLDVDLDVDLLGDQDAA